MTKVLFLSALMAGTMVSVACSDDRPPPSLVGTPRGGEGTGRAGSLNGGGSVADAGQATGGLQNGEGGDQSAAAHKRSPCPVRRESVEAAATSKIDM